MQASLRLAETLRRLNKFSQAEAYYQQCLPLHIQFYGKESTRTANVLAVWCENAEAQGHWQQARSLIGECLAIRLKILGAKHPHTLSAEAALHQIDDYLKSGNAAEPAASRSEPSKHIELDPPPKSVHGSRRSDSFFPSP